MSDRLTLLEIARRAMEGIGLPAPTSLVNTGSDDNAKQVAQCIYDAARFMINDTKGHKWQALKQTGTFLTVAQEDQGDVYTKFDDWRSIINDTVWNVTQQRQIIGPVSDQIWRDMTTRAGSAIANPIFRIFGDHFYIFGQETADETITLEYNSSAWIRKSDGTRTTTITTAADVSLLDGPTMVYGVQTTWLHRNGQDSSEAAARFESALRAKIAEDGGKRIISLNAPSRQLVRGYGETRVVGY